MEPVFSYKMWIFCGLVLAASIALMRWFYGLKHRKLHYLSSVRQPQAACAMESSTLLNEAAPPDQGNARIAAAHFCGPENYNCAQAILRTYQRRFSIPDANIVAARKRGYGKVPGGLCGALYAGKLLLDDEHRSQQLTRDFEDRAGSVRCKQILKLKHISCNECVALTARLLDSLFT